MNRRMRNPIALAAALIVLAAAAPLMNGEAPAGELPAGESNRWQADGALDEIAAQASVPSSILALLDSNDRLLAQADDRPARPRPKARARGANERRLAPDESASESPQHVHTHVHIALTPELIEQSVQVAKEIDPALGRAIAQRREQNPRAFEQLLRQGGDGRRLLALAQLRQRDPDLYRFKVGELTQKIQVRRAADELRRAMAENKSSGEIEVLRDRLKTLVQYEMAMSLKTRGEYLCRLEERVKELREEIEHEAKNFNATVEGRIAAMLQSAEESGVGEDADGAILPASSHEPARP